MNCDGGLLISKLWKTYLRGPEKERYKIAKRVHPVDVNPTASFSVTWRCVTFASIYHVLPLITRIDKYAQEKNNIAGGPWSGDYQKLKFYQY